VLGCRPCLESTWDERESRGKQNPWVGKRDRKVDAGGLV
jgi:hypothetical protein